jgi:hypothetical protein
MKLLFQIDSEDNAGLMWGDVGLIYVSMMKKSGKTEFTLQCHSEKWYTTVYIAKYVCLVG